MGVFDFFKGKPKNIVNKRKRENIVNDNVENQTFHDNGAINEIYNKKDGLIEGIYKQYHQNGNLLHEINYSKGNKQGAFKDYWYDKPNLLFRKGNHNINKLDGTIDYYAYNGEKRMIKIFDNGKELIEKTYFKIDKWYMPIPYLDYRDTPSGCKIIDKTESTKNEMFQIEKENIKEWVSLIESEDSSEFENSYYSLIQHKTDFFLNDELVFRGWELIIEIWDNEDFNEGYGNIYPDLIVGEARKESNEFEAFVITNHPEFDYQELTNGRTTIAEGTAESIAEELAKFKEHDYNNLLPNDKQDFTYFEWLESSKIIKSAFPVGNKIIEYGAELIGAEIYVYNQIISCDERIKQNLDLENYIFLQSLVSEGFDKFDLPENMSLKKDNLGQVIHSRRSKASLLTEEEDKKVFKKLSEKYHKDDFTLKWYTAYKDFKLPSQVDFEIENRLNIKDIKKHLRLFFDLNYPAHEVIINKLRSFKTCIWDIYPGLIYNLNSTQKSIHEAVNTNNHSRIRVKEFQSRESFTSNVEEDKNGEMESYCEIKHELKTSSYQEFLNKLKEIIQEEINVQNEKDRLKYKEKEEASRLSDLSEEHYEKAMKIYDSDDWEGAIIQFNESLKYDQNRHDALYNLSLCKFELNDLEGALSDLNRSIEINDSESISFYMRGLIKSKLNNLDGAIEDYGISINLDSLNFDSRRNRALINIDNGNNELAIEDYNYIINIDSSDLKAFLGRAYLHQRMNNQELALNDFLRVIELDSNYSSAYKECAKIYIEIADLDKTENYLEKYTELVPNDEESNTLLNSLRSQDLEGVDIEENLFYYERVTHTLDGGGELTEFAIWSCLCQKDSDGEWDFDQFEKDQFIEGRFFDGKKNILTENQFDDLYDSAIDSIWITKKISNDLEDLKKLVTLETSSYLKENN